MKNYTHILILLITLLSLIIRIPRFDYPLSDAFLWGDGTRDYLVADHILTFKQLPLSGPYNLFFESGIRNSPIYFYILAFLLIPFNSILVLSVINIILQLITIFLIYLIGKKLFSPMTGVMAGIIYSLNPEIIKLADFTWQPNLMQPAALYSLYLLISAYLKNSLKLLNISLILICLAVSIHNSAFPWLPIFLIIPFILLRKIKGSTGDWFKTFTLIPLSLLIFHSPLFFFYFKNGLSGLSFDNIFSLSFSSNFEHFFQMFYLDWKLAFILINLAALIIFLSHKKSLYTALLLAFSLFILPIIFASFLSKVRLHYLILSISLFPILIAALVSIINGKTWLKVFLTISFILIFSGFFSFLKEHKSPLENYQFINNVTDKVIIELKNVKQEEDFKNYDFFQIISLALSEGSLRYPVLDTVLLVPLEKKLNTKLTEISDLSPYNHIQINKKEYLVLMCLRLDHESCVNGFNKIEPQFNLRNSIYEKQDFLIFLAKAK